MGKDSIYIPKLQSERGNCLINDDTPFIISEAYKTARTNLMFSLASCERKIIVITSANAGEGKSVSCANMALTLAETGASVLIIDADLRKPTIHKLFGTTNKVGLSSILGGLDEPRDCIKDSVMENLDIITSGIIPPNPTELLSSGTMTEFFKAVSKYYDYIFIDTPPINVVTDSQLFNSVTSGIIFVVREGRTTHTDIQAALRAVKLANGKICGFLKVGCLPKGAKGYHGKYKYKYSYDYAYGKKPRK